MELFAGMGILGVALALVWTLLPLILLARVSHWAYQTQKKLETTNELLQYVIEELRRAPERPGAP